jgi:hypothetical protein
MVYLVKELSINKLKCPESGRMTAIIETIEIHRIQRLIENADNISVSSIFYENSTKDNVVNSPEVILDSIPHAIKVDKIKSVSSGDLIICMPENKQSFFITLL